MAVGDAVSCVTSAELLDDRHESFEPIEAFHCCGQHPQGLSALFGHVAPEHLFSDGSSSNSRW